VFGFVSHLNWSYAHGKMMMMIILLDGLPSEKTMTHQKLVPVQFDGPDKASLAGYLEYLRG